MLYDDLVDFEKRLRKLRSDVSRYERVQKQGFMKEAEALSILWFTSLKPQIEGLGAAFEPQVADVTIAMDRLHKVSSRNNLATSYDAAIKAALTKFKDRFLKPIQLAKPEEKTNVVLDKVLGRINDPGDPDESSYLKEAIACAKIGYWRASVVMGWCAAIKNWNKGFQANNLSELQAIFDKDLLTVLEEMTLIDSNESDRLLVCFQYRNQSAHPSKPPIQDVHLAAFYTDIDAIIFSNPNFATTVASPL